MSSSLELNNPEVYYWVFSRNPSLNYFDHPPMVAWMIWLTTINDLIHTEWAVRLGAVFSSSLCLILVFQIGTYLSDQRSGWFAALLYTTSFYGSIATGVFVLPDSPEMVFWFGSIFILLHLIKVDPGQPGYMRKWLWFGVTAGFCILSKTHGVFIWVGAMLYGCFIERRWLKISGFYYGIMISFLIASPILVWNLQNEFASYRFHSSRILFNSGIHPGIS